MMSTPCREWIAAVLLFLLTAPAVTARIYASDEIEYFAYLRSWWFDRDLAFDNEYRHFYDRGIAQGAGFAETFLERTTETGLRLNFAPVGCAILWAPFYAAGDLAARGLRAAGSDVAADGFSAPYIAAVAYASAVYGFLALVCSVLIARQLVGTGVVAAAAVWLGTPLLFYMYVAPPMSHATAAFAVAAFVLAWLHVRRRWSVAGLAGLGALAAIMTMVREQDAFFVVGPAIDLTRHVAGRLRDPGGMREVRRAAGGVLAGAAAFAVAFLPQAFAYLALNGRLGPSTVVSRKMNWLSPHAADVLLSPAHGFLFWTPLAVLAVAGLLLLAWRGERLAAGVHPDASWIATCALLMVAVQVYVSGSVESWTVAGAYGQRRFVSLTALLTLGVAALLRFAAATTPRRTIAIAAIGVAIWWNVGLMAQFGTGLMDRQRLNLGSNAFNTFVVVPRRAPELAARYLFDRHSFYGHAGVEREPAGSPD